MRGYRWTVADHDAEDRATLHKAGIRTQCASKNVECGIKAVKERLKVQQDGRPRLIVCDCCPETISEFFDYAWQPAIDGRNAKEAPIKDRDHAMDPIRYMVMKLDQGRGGGLAIPGVFPGKITRQCYPLFIIGRLPSSDDIEMHRGTTLPLLRLFSILGSLLSRFVRSTAIADCKYF
jgi:hypothetical protein